MGTGGGKGPREGSLGVSTLSLGICQGWRGRQKRTGKRDSQEAPRLALYPCSQSRLSAMMPTGSGHWILLESSRSLQSPAPAGPLLTPLPRTLAPAFHLCPLCSALCSLGPRTPLSSWPCQAGRPLSSPRRHPPGGTGPTHTHLGITTGGAGQSGGLGGCGGPSSALRPPPPRGSAPAFGYGAGTRWH